MQTTVLTAIAAFLDSAHGAGMDYSIKGYFGFAYLTVNWGDGPKHHKFTVLDGGLVEREDGVKRINES
jgi:hypothetical protein